MFVVGVYLFQRNAVACNKESDAVIEDGGERCVGGARIAIASESKQAGAGCRRPARSNHITPGPTPASRVCEPRRHGDGPVHDISALISGRLNLTPAGEIKTGPGSGGSSASSGPASATGRWLIARCRVLPEPSAVQCFQILVLCFDTRNAHNPFSNHIINMNYADFFFT